MASVKDAIASMVKNIEESTGKKIGAWISLARGEGLSKHGEILQWLKKSQGLGHGYANYIAKEALKADGTEDEDLVAAQFSGAKAPLKPLYDHLIAFMKSLGKDVEIAPKKNNVSIRRNKQFALLQVSTNNRIDIGLILKGVKSTDRLEPSGSFNAMFTHRVKVSGNKDFDSELKTWIKDAYKAA